ncbi:MAG: MBL fold metallo-hydrolase [Candidatus Omnitrophota bacterium]|jgi:ribonuclease BN (tRNA processing enzyme)|nr:MBL fold metallo-hydrolase [Candidatus Omnitrophota bacterium]
MDITLLGTGTGVPSSHRSPPCVAIKFGGKTAIFDSGPGTLNNLLEIGIDCLSIDYIFYTHLHLDHVADFASILFAAKIPPRVRKKPLTVYGPKGLKDYYKKIYELYQETICTDSYKLSVEEIENKEITLGGLSISTKTLVHHGGGMGYRILTPKGKIVVYSGDTDYTKDIIELSKGADILITECSTPDEVKMNGHLTPTTAGKVAHQAKVKKLVLVHLYPICDESDIITPCKKEYSGEIIIGQDLMQFEVD